MEVTGTYPVFHGFFLSLHKVFLIPYKECINCPHFSPVIRISSDIILKNRIDLIQIEEFGCHLAVELIAHILIVSLIRHPDTDRHNKSKFLTESNLLRKNLLLPLYGMRLCSAPR